MDAPAREALTAAGVAALLMLVAALENTVAPWAPFYGVYAALALGLPFLLGVRRIGEALRIPRAWIRYGIAAVALAVALQGLCRLMLGTVDLAGMLGDVFSVAAARLRRPPEAIAQAYILFVIIWAGLGEELFYRGYLQTRLRRHLGPAAGILVAAGFFAVRHYTQVLLLWPRVPWWTATVWVAATFVVGLALGWLYEKSASLWPPILGHYLFNLLG